VYYLETAASVAQPFLHGANMSQYFILPWFNTSSAQKLTTNWSHEQTTGRTELCIYHHGDCVLADAVYTNTNHCILTANQVNCSNEMSLTVG
jgi:hypothetical protein